MWSDVSTFLKRTKKNVKHRIVQKNLKRKGRTISEKKISIANRTYARDTNFKEGSKFYFKSVIFIRYSKNSFNCCTKKKQAISVLRSKTASTVIAPKQLRDSTDINYRMSLLMVKPTNCTPN